MNVIKFNFQITSYCKLSWIAEFFFGVFGVFPLENPLTQKIEQP